MIHINRSISIGEDELDFDFVRSSGPGGQNVNKVASAVQLRFNIAKSPSLPEDVRARLIRLGGKRVSLSGVLVIDARRHRSQTKNREDAVQRLVRLIDHASKRPKKRRKTKPSAGAVRRRLENKRHKSEKKRTRQCVTRHDL